MAEPRGAATRVQRRLSAVLPRPFLLIAAAQLISRLGSEITGFVLMVAVFERTHSTASVAMLAAAIWCPSLIFAPFAGVIVDRRSRRTILMFGHAGAGLCSLLAAGLFYVHLESLTLIVVLVAIASSLRAAEGIIVSTLTTILVSPAHRSRANGVSQLTVAFPQLAAPALGGVFLPIIGVVGILAVDVVTFVLAVLLLLVTALPAIRTNARHAAPIRRDLGFGWHYIRARPDLRGLLLVMAAARWTMGMLLVLVTPLVLGFADARVLGGVRSIAGLGALAGCGLMAWRDGTRSLTRSIWAGGLGLAGMLVLLGARPSVWLTALAGFGALFAMPFIVAPAESLWQQLVPVELQGRVFSFRGLVTGACGAVTLFIAGPLADHVFEPFIAGRGRWPALATAVIGSGPGRGVALLVILLGLVMAFVIVYAVRALRLDSWDGDSLAERTQAHVLDAGVDATSR